MRHYDCNSLHFHFAGYHFNSGLILTYTPLPPPPPHSSPPQTKSKIVSKFTHKHASPIHPGIKSLSHSFHSFQSFQSSNSIPSPTQKKKSKKTSQIPISLTRSEKAGYGLRQARKKNKKKGGGDRYQAKGEDAANEMKG